MRSRHAGTHTHTHIHTHTHTHTYTHTHLVIILGILSIHRRMSKPTTGAVGNRTRTNPSYLASDVPAPNKPSNNENLELEVYEIYDEMQN